jgi:NADH-quinone oxidoreductase subunit A
MSSAIDASVGVVGYLALFMGVGLVFVFVNLFIGRFLRPSTPDAEKLEIYECGEPAIGSSFVQFDLRFYVVALVFIIFDVEVAFLFPWATVFGKVTNLFRDRESLVQVVDGVNQLTPAAAGVYREMGDAATQVLPAGDVATVDRLLREGQFSQRGDSIWQGLEVAGLQHLMWISAISVAIFFVVLLVGFAYEWRTGALDWVRALVKTSTPTPGRTIEVPAGSQESVLSA